jgi:hypothetical protein
MLEITLFLAVYTLLIAFTYALCIFFKIGYDASGDDWLVARLIAFFWPIGIWLVLGIALGKKLGAGAESLREAIERKNNLAKKRKLLEEQELEKIINEME